MDDLVVFNKAPPKPAIKGHLLSGKLQGYIFSVLGHQALKHCNTHFAIDSITVGNSKRHRRCLR
jgi:hypothetical protein